MAVIYIATIEGIGEAKVGGAGMVKYCFPAVPSYAGTEANSGLAEAPRGASGQFDIMKTTISAGRFTIILRPGQGPINFQLTSPVAKTITAAAIPTASSGATTVLPVMQGSSVHGFASGDVIYIERESCLVTSTSDTSGSETITVTRGYATSTPMTHPAGADLFATPPAMTGRRVRIKEVPTTAASSGSEVLVLEGYIGSEVASGLHWPTFQVVSEFHDAELNAEPEATPCSLWWFPGSPVVSLEPREGDTLAPRFHASGGYWWIPNISAVFVGSATLRADGIYEWLFDPSPISSPEDFSIPVDGWIGREREAIDAYQIAYSDDAVIDGYPPFKDDSGESSSHPIDCALNILTSRDGAAQDNGNWDLGSTWPEDCTLGIAVSSIDTDSALKLRNMMPNIRSNKLWLGGAKSERLSSVLNRLLGIWGIAVGRGMDGKLKFLRLADVFQTDSTTAITSRHLLRPDQWKQYTKGRSIDSVVINPEPNPEGKTGHPVTINELTGARWYPNQYGCIIGGTEKWDNSPYTNVDFSEDTTPSYALIASRVRRLASRVPMVDVEVGPELFGDLDIGSHVTIHDVAIRDSSTGNRLTAADSALKGIVTSLAPDFSRRTTKLTIAFTSTGKVGTIAPAATVDSWNGASDTAGVKEANFTTGADEDAFKVGDVCVILNANLTTKGSSSQAVTAIGTKSLTFDGDFGVTPASNDVITFAAYDSSTADQKANHAYLADGGRRGTNPTLGSASDAAYTYGDV